MSIEAISWAFNNTPIPTDRRDASTLASVLIGLANHADPDGRNAFPSVARLVRYTRLSERTIRTALDTLEHLGLITPSDPGILAAHIKRADRRPQGWDLNLSTTADTHATHHIAHTAVHSPIHSAVHRPGGGVHPPHPARPDGVQTQPDGVQQRPRGVQPLHPNHPRTIP